VVLLQGFAWAVFQKPELPVRMSPEYRQSAAFVTPVGQTQEGQGIDLPIRAPVDSDATGSKECSLSGQGTGQGVGVTALLDGAEQPTLAAQATPQYTGGNHGRGVRNDIPRTCRRMPSFLNRAVQVGAVALASGFPLVADVRNSLTISAPRV